MFFEAKIRYEKMTEDGSVKRVNEPYILDCLSFTETEARITEELTPYISGDYLITAIKRTAIAEIFRNHEAKEGKWWTVIAAFTTFDEVSGKERAVRTEYLVEADTEIDAINRFNTGMQGTLSDYSIKTVKETQIVDVFDAK